MSTYNNLRKLILTLTGLLTFVLGRFIWLYPPALFPDPSWGFQVLRGMQKGGAFNMLPNPNVDDISKSSSAFLSWWSPGQYLVPYFFISALKLTIARAVALTIILCSTTGVAGFYVFFRKLLFNPLVAALSVAFIACQQAYIIPYSFYNGGEILLFAFVGWFLYGCSYYQKPGLLLTVFVLLSGIIGFFCKSSFLWIYFSGLLYLWIRLSVHKKIITWIINGLVIGLPAMLSLAIIYFGYISRGGNPTSAGQSLKLTWETFCFPLASPLLAGFSIDDLTDGILSQPVIYLILLAGISIALVIYFYKSIPYADYKLLLAVIYIVAVLFFGINFLRQANISFESRHMRVVGLIITPGVIYIINKARLPYQLIFVTVWLFIAWVSIKTEVIGYKRDKYYSAHANSGFSQIFVDQPTLNYITALDRQEHNAVFVFISPDIGLEIKRNSIITFDPLDDNLRTDSEMNVYNGHGGRVYITLPKSYIGTKANVYLKCFPEYKNFIMESKSKNYVIYTAN